MRVKEGATGIVPFLSTKYGKAAAVAFSAAIAVRLYNEVWSNTSVVGGFYGGDGSVAFIGSALLFTLVVLIYSMKGGLRSSIFTDVIQAVVFVVFLALVLILVLPKGDVGKLFTEGSFTLIGGVDLLLISLLQIISYPFHDPVLTDRGFLTEEKTMLNAFIISGLLGFAAILAFSLLGVHARLEGMAATSNVPAMIAKGLGLAGSFSILVIMVSSAASTLDSTFNSLSKLVAKELPQVAGIKLSRPILIGAIMMIIFSIIGNLPMIAGTDILKATTISGTMVIGLAPVFLLSRLVKHSPLSFHLSFWCGMFLGFAYVFNAIPSWASIGSGKNALLLGVNLYGLIMCFILFLLPVLIRNVMEKK
jgi:Na+/proline symporter